MKRITNILLALCLMTISVYAQEPTQQTQTQTQTQTTTTVTPTDSVKATPKAEENTSGGDWRGMHIGGFAQATFTDFKIDGGDGTLKTSYVVGYGAGGFIGYFFSRHTELRLEVLYSALTQEIAYNDVKRNVNLSYINFPLLFALHTGYDRPVNLNVTFGPQVGINTSSSLDGEGEDGIDTVQAVLKVKAGDLGVAYGAGLDFGLGPDRLLHLNVGFRGVYGIIDISDDSKTTTTNNFYILDRSKINTYSLYAGLSYKF